MIDNYFKTKKVIISDFVEKKIWERWMRILVLFLVALIIYFLFCLNKTHNMDQLKDFEQFNLKYTKVT